MRNELRLQAGLLHDQDRERVRAACRTPKERAMVEMLWTCRRAEAAALRWGDLKLTEGLVEIRRGKGGRADWSLLLPVTVAALVAWHQASGSPPPTAWVFPVPGSGWPARPYTPCGYGRIVQHILQRAGCWWSGLGSAHRFRRTFATQYLRDHPGQVVQLQRLLRHRDVSTTSRYCHLQPADLAPSMAQVAL